MSMERTSIEIAGIACPGRHGAYPGERDAVRTFLVDLTLDGPNDARIVEAATAAARHAVAAESHALLERVADDVAREILEALPAVEAVRVRVVKPDPRGLRATLEAITLTRARS